MSIYMYRIALGIATLNKGDNFQIKTIGKFKTDKQAKEACEKHYEKVLISCKNLGKEPPVKYYV